MDGLGVPDELQDGEVRRPIAVVVPDRVLVPIDRDDGEMANPPDAGQRGRDRVGLGEVEHEPGRPPIEGGHGRVDVLLRLARQHDVLTRFHVVLRDLEPDRRPFEPPT